MLKKTVLVVCILFLFVGTASAFSGDGSGTESDPYQITDVDELQEMEDDLSAHYVLMNDIDASGTESWNGDAGFKPIGNDIDSFTGSFDGQKHLISNLYINRDSTDYVGLFGKSSGSFIENVILTHVDITGKDDVGGLVGDNGGVISVCGVSGNVGSDGLVGGFVGTNNGNINESYSNVDTHINTDSNKYVGGFVGENYESITDSFSVGDSIGNSAGGFCGGNVGNIENCYSTGKVDASYSGGFILDAFDPVNNCYWNTDTSEQTTSDGGTGLTDSEMKDSSNFNNWDFTDVWTMGTYPILQWNFELQTPENETEINVTYPPLLHETTLSWSYPDDNAFRYQIAEDESFDNIIREDETTNTEVSLGLPGGEYYWRVYPYDEDTGETGTVSDTYSFTIESTELQILDEETTDLIDDREIDVTFYEQGGGGDVVIKNTTDGTVNLDYIPKTEDSEYVIGAKADGYISRNAILDEDATMYLISNTTEANELIVQITDHTSQYPSTTTKLFIEKAIQVNGDSEWRQVSGDYVGADQQYSDFLVDGDRYRFRLTNDEGETRIVGQYNSLSAELIDLIVGDLSWEFEKEKGYNTQITYTDETDEGEPDNGIIRFQFDDEAEKTTAIGVQIYEKENESNVIFEDSVTGTFGEYSAQQAITGNQTDTEWIVDYNFTRDGETKSFSEPVRPGGGVVDFPIDGNMGSLILMLLLLFFALMFGGAFASIGAVVVCGMAGILWYLGWQLIPIEVIIAAGIISILFLITDREAGL